MKTSKNTVRKKQKALSFDRVFDTVLLQVGVTPEGLETFLSEHKREARFITNIVSVTRIVLGFVAIRNYEKAKEKNDKKTMMKNIVFLGLLLASDAVDGYLARKAHIHTDKSGKVIDSVSDVTLRLYIAQSSLFEHDELDVMRAVGELFVASSAIPDIVKGTYASTDVGKLKVNTDAVAVITKVLHDVTPKEASGKASLQLLHDLARRVSTGLAWKDGFDRMKK